MTLAVILFAWKDALAKLTGGYYSPILIIWAQVVFMFGIWFPILVYKYGWRWLIPRPLSWQVARGLSAVTAIGIFYWAILLIPLADATAMAFTAPLIVTALSPWVLEEKVGVRRWSAVIIGFLGALILLRPALVGDSIGFLLAFISGLLLGFFYTANRKLADAAPPLVSVAYTAYMGVIVLTPLVPLKWVTPRPEDSWLILGFVVLSAIGQSCLVTAFRFGQASRVAPFHFIHIVAATFFGFLIFDDFPDMLTWVVCVCCSVKWAVYCNQRDKKDVQTIGITIFQLIPLVTV